MPRPTWFSRGLLLTRWSLPLDVQQSQFSVQILHFGAVELTGPPAPRVAFSPVPGPFIAMDSRLQSHTAKGTKKMLWTICLILLVLWALGMATSYTAGGLIHILLVVALVVVVFRLIQGRSVI
jgi:Family of unknown function (DUF5670)